MGLTAVFVDAAVGGDHFRWRLAVDPADCIRWRSAWVAESDGIDVGRPLSPIMQSHTARSAAIRGPPWVLSSWLAPRLLVLGGIGA